MNPVASTVSASALMSVSTAAIVSPSIRTSARGRSPIARSMDSTVPPRIRSLSLMAFLTGGGLVGGESAYRGGHLVSGGEDLLFEAVGERERHAGRGDPADRGVEGLEALVGHERGDGTAPAALVRVLLDDDQAGSAPDRVEDGTDVQRDEAPQIDDLDVDPFPGNGFGRAQGHRYGQRQRDQRDVGTGPDHRGLAQRHHVVRRRRRSLAGEQSLVFEEDHGIVTAD